jgi:uncharacterized protein
MKSHLPGWFLLAQSRRGLWLLIAALGLAFTGLAAEVIPPAPKAYFNDYANAVSPAARGRLNERLKRFQDETSNQILVAIFPKMQSDSSIEDYTVRVAEAWKAGQKEKDNGVVLFVFMAERSVYIQVGYGLEGALPDVLAKRIIEREITPRFRRGDFDGGLTSGVEAIMAATKGEYKPTAGPVGPGRPSVVTLIVFFLVFGFVGLAILRALSRGLTGRRRSPWGGWTVGSGGWHSSGGGWSGGWGGGGGGGFSGGGGSFGGGGAGGRW